MPHLFYEINNRIHMEQSISPIIKMSVLVFCIVSYLLYHNVTFLLLPLQTINIVIEIIKQRQSKKMEIKKRSMTYENIIEPQDIKNTS